MAQEEHLEGQSCILGRAREQKQVCCSVRKDNLAIHLASRIQVMRMMLDLTALKVPALFNTTFSTELMIF
jgi:hypothetical protein